MYSAVVRQHALDLINSGDSLRSVSMLTGINRTTLREWRDNPERVQAARTYCPRCGDEPVLPEPRADYAYLLGLYLGDGCISVGGSPSKGGVAAAHPVRGRLAWASSGMRADPAVGPADQQGHAAAEAGMPGSLELLPSLAVPVPAARPRQKAPPTDRTPAMVANDRDRVSWRVRARAVPFGRVPGDEPGAAGAGRRGALVRVPAVPVQQQVDGHPEAVRRGA